jgi:hypothetical protein
MAGKSKPRKPIKAKPVQHASRSSAIKHTVNQALGKFYIVGDQAHMPISFGIAELAMRLRNPDLGTAKRLCLDFLFEEANSWVITVYHFFNHDGVINVVPIVGRIEKTTCDEAANVIIPLANESKTELLASEDFLGFDDDYMGYGYYMTWFNELGVNLDSLDDQLIPSLMKVNADFQTKIEKEVLFTGLDVVKQIGAEKFSISDSDAIETEYEALPEFLFTF